MIFFRCKYLYVLLLFFVELNLSSQVELISEKSLSATSEFVNCIWQKENGLPHNHILALCQTADKFLWVSTANGLCRFDGQQFQVFNTQNTPALPSNSFRYLMEDKKSCLWMVSTDNKLIKFQNGKFHPVIFGQPVGSICENVSGEFFITFNQHVYSYKNNKLTFLFSVEGKTVYQLVAGLSHELYAVTESGIDLYHQGKHRVIYRQKIGSYSFIAKASEGNIYALLDTKKVVKIVQGDFTEIENLNILPYRNQVFVNFFMTTEKEFWVSTDAGILHIQNHKMQYMNVASGLSSNSTSVLFIDFDKNIWVGTLNEGLNKLKQKLIRTYGAEDGLAADNCGPLLKLRDNSLLISNFCKGIVQLKNGKFGEPLQQNIHCFYALLTDSTNGVLWAGTYGSGIHCYKERHLVKNITTKEGLPDDKVFSIFQDHQQTIWVGTQDGLCTFKKGKLSASFSVKGKVSFITEDSKKNIWFCFDKGIGEIVNNKIKVYTPGNNLLTGNVRYLYEDNEGTFWIATYGSGLLRFKNGEFFFFPEVIDKYVSCIIEDAHENLWISTNKGVYMGKKNGISDYADGKAVFLPVQYYGKQDGMRNEECNGGFQYPGLKTADGHIAFPTQNGLATINPDLAKSSLTFPKINIQSVTVDTNHYFNPDSIDQISSSSHSIAFNFTAPFFDDPHNLLFQYRLDGYDSDWSLPLINVRQARYISLPPGQYTFRLRIYGNLTEKKIAFEILPPFWKTDLFLYPAIAVGVCLFIAIFFYRIRRNRKRETKKNELIRRYSRLELNALQTQINPHFTFNCLNSINYFIAANKNEEAGIYLSKFSRLLRMFIEHSRSEFITIREEITLLTLYCELEKLRFNEPFNFEIKIDKQRVNENMTIPSMILQHFVENAINHGLKNLDRKGTLLISFHLQSEGLIVTVEDDGIGRISSKKINSQKIDSHISRGSDITRERIDLINTIKKMHIKVDITDNYPDKEETGTKVIIYLPLN